jgi:hypothetical protein
VTITDKPVLCRCPKCRSSSVYLIEACDHGYSTYGRFWYRVECLECGYFIADREEFNREAKLIYPEGDCIKVWNLYSQPNKDSLIAELVDALKQIAWHSALVPGAAGDFQRTANDALKKAKVGGASWL